MTARRRSTTMTGDELDILFERLASEPPDRRWELARKFMIASLEAIEAKLPEAAKRALVVAREHLLGNRTDDELVRARVACWEAADRIEGTSTTITHRDTAALRATICALYATLEDGDFDALLPFFCELANRVQNRKTGHIVLLRQLLEA